MRIVHGNSEFNISKYKGGKNLFDKTGLKGFVNDYLAGKIEKYFKSEPAPKDNKGPILVRTNLFHLIRIPFFKVDKQRLTVYLFLILQYLIQPHHPL